MSVIYALFKTHRLLRSYLIAGAIYLVSHLWPVLGKWSGTCVLLRECVPGDCLANLCTSGPAECKDIPEPCPQLNRAHAAAGKVTWDCGATLNPYNSPIAADIICTARWEN